MIGVKPRLAVFCCLAIIGIIAGSCAKDRVTGPRGSWDVSGTATDSITGVPIDSVHMIFGDTSILRDTSMWDGVGVYTDSNGHYRIEVPVPVRSIVAIRVGYQPGMREFSIFQSGHTIIDLDFKLKPE